MSMQSKKRSNKDIDETKNTVNIEDTAAKDLTNPNDRAIAFSIIESLVLNTDAKCSHKPIQSPPIHGCSYYTIRFTIELPLLNIRTLSSLVSKRPFSIRDMTIMWPSTYATSTSVNVNIQIFHHWVLSDVDGKPSASADAPVVSHTDMDVPRYVHQHYRETRSKEILDTTKFDGIADIPTWEADKQLLASIMDTVYNMEQDLPRIETSMNIEKRLGNYKLTFSGMECVTYAFIEYLTKTFPRITNVQFACSGTSERSMIITVTFKPTNNNIGTLYLPRFMPIDKPKQALTQLQELYNDLDNPSKKGKTVM